MMTLKLEFVDFLYVIPWFRFSKYCCEKEKGCQVGGDVQKTILVFQLGNRNKKWQEAGFYLYFIKTSRKAK